MNDPHLAALIYDIEHDSSITYDQVSPLTKEVDGFTVKIGNEQVRLEPKKHYSSLIDALKCADDFVKNWELNAALHGQPGHFSLVFNHSEIIDLNPTPGTVELSASIRAGRPHVMAKLQTVASSYPEPPLRVTLDYDDDDVVRLFNRYRNYREGKELLSSMAYFCSTLLDERTATNSEDRGKIFKISSNVRRDIKRLSSRHGGAMGARKWDAINNELDESEVRFLEEAVKLIIRRAAEVALDDTKQLPDITLADLPKIPSRNY